MFTCIEIPYLGEKLDCVYLVTDARAVDLHFSSYMVIQHG